MSCVRSRRIETIKGWYMYLLQSNLWRLLRRANCFPSQTWVWRLWFNPPQLLFSCRILILLAHSAWINGYRTLAVLHGIIITVEHLLRISPHSSDTIMSRLAGLCPRFHAKWIQGGGGSPVSQRKHRHSLRRWQRHPGDRGHMCQTHGWRTRTGLLYPSNCFHHPCAGEGKQSVWHTAIRK